MIARRSGLLREDGQVCLAFHLRLFADNIFCLVSIIQRRNA